MGTVAEAEPQPTDGQPGVWEYLRRRSELDQEIQSKFARPVTIMFTDIKGSTAFFDTRGDIEGITMLQRHNEQVFPRIEAAGGRVIKRLGDGLMVTFPDPAGAVRAAIEIQRALAEFNTDRPEREQIQLRVGINTGVGIVEENDIFGDVVNATARVQGLAEPGQILVTEAVYAKASPELGTALFHAAGAVALKGKSGDVVLYEVVWSSRPSPLRQATRGAAEGYRVFVLELSRDLERLKVSAYEQASGEEQTLRAYEELEWDDAQVRQAVDRIAALLDVGDAEGRIASRELEELANLGQLLYRLLLPAQTREKLAQSTAAELMLVIDDQLVEIPWELLHDGRDYLSLRFGIGRTVRTPQPVALGQPREARSPLRVVIVADPRGDLPDSRREGVQLSAQLGRHPELRVVTPGPGVTRQEFLTHFTTCDLLHFAGHAEYDRATPAASSFLLSDGPLSATELVQLTNAAGSPRLIFLNACQSGQTPDWRASELATRVFGLANAILLTGVKHYLGTIRRLPDRAGFHYALELYRQLGAGQSVGVAVREARRAVVKRHGKTSLTWASYVLYGDPASRYVSAPTKARRRFRLGRAARLKLAGAGVGLAAVAVAAFLAGVLRGPEPRRMVEGAYRKLEAGELEAAARDFQTIVRARPALAYEGLAAVAFRQDDLAKAESLCLDVLRIDSRRPGCLLIQGDLHLLRGDPARAAPVYEAVAASAEATPVQQAVAYNRMGRVAAEQGQTDQAATAYVKAQELDPRNWESLSNLGVLLRAQGRYAESVGVLEKAAALRPGDALVQTLLGESREAASVARDHERQRRLDELVAELSRRYRRGDVVRPRPESDEWTSRPLTFSLLGVESRGRVAFREGEHEFFAVRLGQVLGEQARVRLVERNVLDKLLAELKLGSSALVDPNTALRLGRLLSARLISVGSIAGIGGEWQVTLRVIETETSAVVASVARSFPVSQATRGAAELLGKELAEKIVRAYPLRARVVEVGTGEVTLNLGSLEGAVTGLRFQLFRESARGAREVVAEVELVEVRDRQSRARVLGERAPVVAGLKALQLT